jgi:sulfotransferase family protein
MEVEFAAWAGPATPSPGPLFVVGMPRSGTKLIRDLLRGHSRIRIPPAETNFLPRWAEEWLRYGNLSNRKNFSAFYRRSLRFPYFRYMREHTTAPTIPEDVWYSACGRFEPANVFEALIRYDVGAPPRSDLVWGDKSPDYIEHVDLLAGLFPSARVIHIVRDVRDCCLSLRETWGKSMIRGAQRWVDGVTKAHHDAELLAGRYLEVRYEDLLSDPGRELRRCCDFLGLEFEPSMIRLRLASEDPGGGKGSRDVLSTNTRRFVHALDSRTKARIEAIAAPVRCAARIRVRRGLRRPDAEGSPWPDGLLPGGRRRKFGAHRVASGRIRANHAD